MQLEWARLLGETSLIIAPLSVVRQTLREAQRIGLSLKALTAKPAAGEKSQKDKAEAEAIAQIESAQSPKPAAQGPLKGGLGSPSGGEEFGIKW